VLTNAPVQGYALPDYLTDYTLTLAILLGSHPTTGTEGPIERLEGTKAYEDARRLLEQTNLYLP